MSRNPYTHADFQQESRVFFILTKTAARTSQIYQALLGLCFVFHRLDSPTRAERKIMLAACEEAVLAYLSFELPYDYGTKPITRNHPAAVYKSQLFIRKPGGLRSFEGVDAARAKKEGR